MNKDTDPKHWKLGGLFYYNPENPSVIVDKRKGLGVTINFGSKQGRRTFLLIFLPAVVLIAICIAIEIF